MDRLKKWGRAKRVTLTDEEERESESERCGEG